MNLESSQEFAKRALTGLPPHRRHGLLERLADRLSGAIAVAQSSVAMALFGEVDQLKVDSERSSHLLSSAELEAVDDVYNLLPECHSLLATTKTKVNGGAAEPLHVR
jgi:hypothetical protein